MSTSIHDLACGKVHSTFYRNHFVVPCKVPTSAVTPSKLDSKLKSLILRPCDITCVVAHFPCPDGFVSSLIALSVLPGVRVILVNHDQLEKLDPKELMHENVAFLDIIPFENLSRQLTNFIVLDHHMPNADRIAHVPENQKVIVKERSGCGLAWMYFYSGFPMLELFQAIEKLDLGLGKDDDNVLRTGMLATCGYCPNCWMEKFNHMDLQTARTIEKERQDSVQLYVKTAKPRMWHGIRTWVVNVPDASCISDIGAQLVSKNTNDIAMILCFQPKERVFRVSLRSKMDEHQNIIGPDVAALAKLHRGGGHPCAAGFTFKGDDIEELFCLKNQ